MTSSCKPRSAGAIDGQPAHQHDARLRAGSFDDGNPRQTGLEALRQEPRQQPAHQPVFEVNLHDFRRVAAVREPRRLERDGADRRALAPFGKPFAALARTRAQIVERVLPAGLLGEGGIVRVEPERSGLADSLGARRRRAKDRRAPGGADDPLKVMRIDPDALARMFERICRSCCSFNSRS